MGNLMGIVAFIVTVNVLLIMVQVGSYNINSEFTQDNPFIKCNETIGGSKLSCGTTSVGFNGGNVEGELPNVVVQSQEGTNFLTDTYNTISKWFQGTTVGQGLSYLTYITGGVGAVLKTADVDESFANLINLLWWAITFIVIIAFIKGGDA